MTAAEAILKIDASIQYMEDLKPYTELFNHIKGLKAERIFLEGKDANGSDIGKYSTEPIYVNPKSAPRSFATKGKNGQTKFKNGKSHKTGYFAEYGNFKATIGEGDRVNLRLFRNFEVSFKTAQSAKKENGLIVYTASIADTAKNPSGKIEGLLSKYPNAFESSKEEIAIIRQDLIDIAMKKL